jgi:hypothetical protein
MTGILQILFASYSAGIPLLPLTSLLSLVVGVALLTTAVVVAQAVYYSNQTVLLTLEPLTQ